MIKVKNLTKYYGATRAIEDVSFDVPEGAIMGFLGPNAAGKSTTMRIITCYTPPTRGHVTVAGYDIMKNSLEVRRLIGYMPETVPLYRDMLVQSYLNFVAEAKHVDTQRRRSMINEVIQETGLSSVAHRLIGNLSKGFQQRVGLAQALVGDPRVLILDEPTVGLDPQQIIEIRKMIKSMAQKRTVILCSHILPEVSHVCSHVVIISAGKVVAHGTTDELVSEFASGVTSIVLVRGDLSRIEKALHKVSGVQSVKFISKHGEESGEFEISYSKGKDLRPAISRAVFVANADLLEFRTLGLSLEDIFIRVITAEEKEVPTHVA